MQTVIKDTYKTLSCPSEEILFKEKNSKFFAYAYPILSEEEVKNHLDFLKKQHHSARHWCYAYQMGTEKITFRANSAGMPIYGQIQSFDLTYVLIVVVRYFGGIKLGVGGLISSYKIAAQMALEQAEIIEKTIDVHFLIVFDYKNMNKVMRVIKEKNLSIIAQKMEMDCKIEIATRKKNADMIYDIFSSMFEIDVQIME
jgi:putative IMPACT (imprinted ancient) family translation regulator